MFSRFSLVSPHFFITLSIFLHVQVLWLAVEVLAATETVDGILAGRLSQFTASARGTVDSSISGRHDFTSLSPEERGAHTDGPLADLPATALDLVLMGVVDGEGQDSRAVILSRKDQAQQLYQVGDTVAGAQIRSIRWGRVELRVQGRDEVLDMSGTAGYRRKETALPVPVSAPKTLPAPLRKSNAASVAEESGSSLIPERVRLVLPGQNQ